MTHTISIRGMTCDNCVRHVTEALQSVPGVRSVSVDLKAASAQIESEREVPHSELAAALDDAGYALA